MSKEAPKPNAKVVRAPAKPRGARAAKAGGGLKAKSAATESRSGARPRDREVLEAAVRIFWEKGYAAASVQDVADALGMLKGSLYYYIDSKESLLHRIFEDSHTEIVAITAASMQSDAPAAERLRSFLHDYAMWTLTHIERAGLYAREWRFASDHYRVTLVGYQRFYFKHLRDLISLGQIDGSCGSGVDPRAASLFILAAFTGLPDWYRPEMNSKSEDVAEAYVGIAMQAVGADAITQSGASELLG
jgi:AcrR family transcriptional regulator